MSRKIKNTENCKSNRFLLLFNEFERFILILSEMLLHFEKDLSICTSALLYLWQRKLVLYFFYI